MKAIWTRLDGSTIEVEILDTGEDDHGPYADVRFPDGAVRRIANDAGLQRTPHDQHTKGATDK